jgi:hypothetical protein
VGKRELDLVVLWCENKLCSGMSLVLVGFVILLINFSVLQQFESVSFCSFYNTDWTKTLH